METLVCLMILAGGGLFAYRQWQMIRQQAGRVGMRPEPPAAVIGDGPTIHLTPEPIPPVSQGNFRMNKWLFALLCLVYIVSPIDFVPDVIPVAGWGDDVVALGMAIHRLIRS